MTTRRTRRSGPGRLAALTAVLLTASLGLTGCGGSGSQPKAVSTPTPSTDLPTGNVAVPAGVTLTKAGTQLTFGQTATVAYEPNSQRSSVLAMTVASVQTGRIADFGAYQLDDRTKASTPYYVKVTVKNVGQGDLSRTGVPLLAVDTRNTLIQPSSFNNTFGRCPSTPLPAGFTAGKAAQTCLVYLVPAGGTLVSMSFRPLQAFEPIQWKGTIAPPAAVKKKKG